MIPSFLIECLCYRVEDTHYLYEEDRHDRAVRLLKRMKVLLADQTFVWGAREINDIKLLFHNTQPWTVDAARLFVEASLVRLGVS